MTGIGYTMTFLQHFDNLSHRQTRSNQQYQQVKKQVSYFTG